MKQTERHARIIEIVTNSGFATIEELANQFNVTQQTIRRDLKELDNENKIQRYHGGAGLNSSTLITSYSNRKVSFLKEKQ